MRFDGSRWETINPRERKNGAVYGVVSNLQSDGNKIYVATSQYNDTEFKKELLIFDGIKWDKVNHIPEDGNIIKMIVDKHRQVVWVPTPNKGLFKVSI